MGVDRKPDRFSYLYAGPLEEGSDLAYISFYDIYNRRSIPMPNIKIVKVHVYMYNYGSYQFFSPIKAVTVLPCLFHKCSCLRLILRGLTPGAMFTDHFICNTTFTRGPTNVLHPN